MNKGLGFGLIGVSTLALVWACEDSDGPGNCNPATNDNCVGALDLDDPEPMPTAGAGGGTSTAGTTAGGSTAGGSAAGGSGPAPMDTTTEGAAFTVSGNVASSEEVSIFGAVYDVENSAADDDATRGQASVIDELTAEGDQICVKGSIRGVPTIDGETRYDQYWGIQAGMNLNQVAAVGAAPAGDAGLAAGDAGVALGGDAGVALGGDAGAGEGPALADEAAPWPPGLQGGGPAVTDAGEVLGFAFTLADNGPGLPLAMRMTMTLSDPDPGAGSPTEDPNFCSGFSPVAGERNQILFSEVIDKCWGSKGVWGFRPPIVNIGWQIPSDTGGAFNFDYDFCITDIRPILAQ